MSLLSPSESNAFQTFLSSLDYPDADSVTLSSAEWALYNANTSMYSPHDDSDANPEHREALIKATKDLMSLDSDNWNSGASMMDHNPNGMHYSRQGYGVNGHSLAQYDQQEHDRLLVHQQQVLQHQRQHRQQQQQHQQEQQRHNSLSTTHEVFPFLTDKGQHPELPELQYPMHPMQMRQQQHPSIPSMNGVSSDHSSPTSPHSPYTFHPQHNTMPMSIHQQQQQMHMPQQQGMSASGSRNTQLSASQSAPTGLNNASRPTNLHIPSSTSNPNAAASTSSHPNGYNHHNNKVTNGRPSTNGMNGNAFPKRQRSSASPPISSPREQQLSTGTSKQTLLSPSQKKANHIQSEQKRRANIRRGYEALCETVPALREAIREEEEAERNGTLGRGGNINGVQRKKKSRGKKNGKDSEEKEKDRLDGRAGPRSENVVLSKTIDHIQTLLSDRSSLLARLHHARSSLPPGHPALLPVLSDPPWEREWKGGDGRLGDEDPDGEGNGSEGEEGEDDGE